MKKLLIALALISGFNIIAQSHKYCSEGKIKSLNNQFTNADKVSAPSAWTSHEKAYDVKFVHLNLNCERNTKYLSGNVKTVATVTLAAMDTFMCLLHQNFIIDSIYVNGAKRTFVRKDSMVKTKTAATITTGQSFTATVYYKGTAPTGGSAIGSGYSTGNYNGIGMPFARDAGAHYDNKWNKDKQSINVDYKIGALNNEGTSSTITQNNLPGNFNKRNHFVVFCIFIKSYSK